MRSEEEIEKKINELYDELMNRLSDRNFLQAGIITLKIKVLRWVLGEVEKI